LICKYLDDCFPTPRLMPADPYCRTRVRLWSKAVDETLFEATRELSFSAMFRARLRRSSAPSCCASDRISYATWPTLRAHPAMREMCNNG
jgi:hypothetical protein